MNLPENVGEIGAAMECAKTRIFLIGVAAVVLFACGEDSPADSGPVLNTEPQSDNMGAYLVREWDANLGELRYTSESVSVWIDWQFVESVDLEDGRVQINGTYDIRFTNTTEREMGGLLITLSFKNVRNGTVTNFRYDPELQINMGPMDVLNVDGEFQAVVDDLAQAELIVNIEVGVQFTFSRS
jgi:hypothetical protein